MAAMDLGRTQTRWDLALAELETLYKGIEKRSLSLPWFSLRPIAILFWNTLKFEFCLMGDIFLLIPMNLVIFLRNLFPGKWLYRSFSERYWRYMIAWLWRGEAPYAPIGVIRPLVSFLLNVHFYGRIKVLEKYLILDETVADDERARLETKIARLEQIWRRPAATQVFYGYVLPVSGPLLELYRFLFPGRLPDWAGPVSVLAMSYTLGFVVSAFCIKRALMLEATGRAAYFPGAIEGTGCYEKERGLFGSLGIRQREFPLDVVFLFFTLATGIVFSNVMLRFYALHGITISTKEFHVQLLIQTLIYALLGALVLYRRGKTGRA